MNETCLKQHENVIREAAQGAQDAQAGYTCDDSAKRQPVAFNEVKECRRGHETLSANLATQSIKRIRKRHAMRLMSDAYATGIVRGQEEHTHLRAKAKDHYVTSA